MLAAFKDVLLQRINTFAGLSSYLQLFCPCFGILVITGIKPDIYQLVLEGTDQVLLSPGQVGDIKE